MRVVCRGSRGHPGRHLDRDTQGETHRGPEEETTKVPGSGARRHHHCQGGGEESGTRTGAEIVSRTQLLSSILIPNAVTRLLPVPVIPQELFSTQYPEP